MVISNREIPYELCLSDMLENVDVSLWNLIRLDYIELVCYSMFMSHCDIGEGLGYVARIIST